MPARAPLMPLRAAPDDPILSRIRCRVHPRARRISLRVDAAQGCIVLVRPARASDTLVAAFLRDQRRWIEKHLAALPERQTIGHGAALSILGHIKTVHAAPEAKRGVWSDGDLLFVSGAAEHMPRRVKDFIKDEARRAFSAWARAFAEKLNVKVTRIGVRDTTTRWGSCTKDGNLSLSWRLALAPVEVAAYVVAHEVAHLKHMNHSPAFWRTVEQLIGDINTPRTWLRRHGAQLHRML